MGTTGSLSILEDMQMKQAFNVILHTPILTKVEEVRQDGGCLELFFCSVSWAVNF
jgi:hypothetical protein